MVCYHPVTGYRSPSGQIVTSRKAGYADREVTRACGGCVGCRLEYSRRWAVRIAHEASLYESNVFLTLTYRDEDLPDNASLRKRDWQLFMKRLKKRSGGRSIRFFHCGEYGETTNRPHYHAILFDYDFSDRKFLKMSETDMPIDTSQKLDDAWQLGDCYIGSVTFESAAYCARYVMKKLTGQRKSEYGSLEPEYATQSRKPGIGKPWLNKWKCDTFPNDFIVINGQKQRVPTYYDDLLKQQQTDIGYWTEDKTGYPLWMPYKSISDRTELERIKDARTRNANKHSENNTPERLAVREELQLLRLEKLART
nr:MAG: replication initiator protein [Microvirus sp.]